MARNTSSREHMLVRLINSDRPLPLREVGRLLGVSRATVYRDLQRLAQQGLIIRTLRGVIAKAPGTVRAKQDVELLRRLSPLTERATDLIPTHATVLFGTHPVMVDVALALARRGPFTAITPSLLVATVLGAFENVQVFMPGGRLDASTQTIVGRSAEDFLARIRADVVVVAPAGLTNEGLLVDQPKEVANLKRVMLQRGRMVVALLCDGSADLSGTWAVGTLPAGATLLCQRTLPAHVENALVRLGVTVRQVS